MPRNKDQSEQMRAESQKKILDTARRLFAERGFDGCSVADIARHAEMSKGNIYWYFSSKEELFGAILMDGFETLGAMMAEAARGSGTGSEKLDGFIDQFISIMKEEDGDEFITIVFNFISQGGVGKFSEFGIATAEIGAGYHHSLNTIFEQGQAEGAFLAGGEPDLLSTFFFSFINGLILMYPDEWRDIPNEKISAALMRLLGANQNQ